MKTEKKQKTSIKNHVDLVPARLSPADQQRMLRVLGFLARPSLSPKQQERLLRIVKHPKWRPLPRLASTHLLEPLFRHHCTQSGVSFDHIFLPPPPSAKLNAPSFSELAMADFRRRQILQKALVAFQKCGVERVLLIKGSALGPLYPSPALRQMCDADLVVEPDDFNAASQALEKIGCKKRFFDDDILWTHPSKLMFDLHAPDTPLTRRVFDRAVPHPSYKEFPKVFAPRRSDHLIVLAKHTARDGGGRIWRDICDAHVALQSDSALQAPQKALDDASEMEDGVVVSAFFRFINQHSPASIKLPTQPASNNTQSPRWASTQERLCQRYVWLYEEMAADPISPSLLNLLRFTQRSPRDTIQIWAQRIVQKASPSKKATARSAAQPKPSKVAERDPILGDLPAQGRLGRIGLKTRLLFEMIRSGHFARYRKILQTQQKISQHSGKPFPILKARPSK